MELSKDGWSTGKEDPHYFDLCCGLKSRTGSCRNNDLGNAIIDEIVKRKPYPLFLK